MKRIGALPRLSMVFTVLVVVMRPHPRSVPDWLAVYGGDMVLVGGVVASVLLLSREFSLPASSFKAWLFAYLSIQLMLTLAFLDTRLITEILKLQYYLAFCLWLMAITRRARAGESFYWRCLSWPLVAMSVVAVVQYWELPIAFEVFADVWGDEKLRSVAFDAQNARVFGPFFNSNWFGWAAGYYCVALVQVMLRGHARLRNAAAALSILSLLLVFLSGSRSALVSTLIGLCISAGLNIWHRANGKWLVLGAAGVVSLPFAIMVIVGPSTLSRFETLYDIVSLLGGLGEPSATNSRIAYWQVGLSHAVEWPWGGAHPGGDFLAHNSFITATLHFGVPLTGVVIVSLAFGFALVMGARADWVALSPLIAHWATMALTGEFLFSTQVMLCMILNALLVVRVLHHAAPHRDEGWELNRVTPFAGRIQPTVVTRRQSW